MRLPSWCGSPHVSLRVSLTGTCRCSAAERRRAIRPDSSCSWMDEVTEKGTSGENGSKASGSVHSPSPPGSQPPWLRIHQPRGSLVPASLRLGCAEDELRPKVGFTPSGILIYPPVTVVFLLLLALLLPPGEGLADRSKRVRGSGGERSPRRRAEGGGADGSPWPG